MPVLLRSKTQVSGALANAWGLGYDPKRTSPGIHMIKFGCHFLMTNDIIFGVIFNEERR